MKKLTILVTVASTIFFVACSENTSKTEQTPATTMASSVEPSHSEMVKKGEYLVSIMGCHDCHSPKKMTQQGPVPDPELLLSGHPANEPLAKIDAKATQGWVLFSMGMTAIKGPWGMSFSANLTPDETGIANWTFENFKKAFKEGKAKGLEGGRMLLPPMPWQVYANVTDEDAKAIFTYLKSIKPIKNLVPAPKTPNQI
jgi:hypothetical protein